MIISKEQFFNKTVQLLRHDLKSFLKQKQLLIKYSQLYDKYNSYTMIPKHTFLENLKLCHSYSHLRGCIIECGVWRGGMIAAISEILGQNRNYYLFDSFEGLPEAKAIDGEAAIRWQSDKDGLFYLDNCKAEISYADEVMKISGAKSYEIIKGWFSDTLPKFTPKQEIAILRLDGDWYDSTMQCLISLYPLVTKGGVIIVDDYYAWDGCSRAIHDYLSIHSLSDRIFQIGGNCYIIKNSN